MSEQAPTSQSEQQSDEYMQTHPNAIADPAKAEVMAYASRGQEEQVVEARRKALEAASHTGNYRNNWRQDNYSAENAANRQAGFAEKARQEADKHAQAAADIYDKVKHL